MNNKNMNNSNYKYAASSLCFLK